MVDGKSADTNGPELKLGNVQKISHSREVFDTLKAAIQDGRLGPGDKLPGERQLAEMLGVSRTSVREGLRVMEALGITAGRTGSGPNAGTFILEEPTMALTQLLGLNISLSHFSIDEVVGVRRFIEKAAMETLTSRRSEIAKELFEICDKMEVTARRKDYAELDAKFHLAIVQGSDNRLLSFLMITCQELIQRSLEESFRNIKDWDTASKFITSQHRAIAVAFATGEISTVHQLIDQHVTGRYGSA